MLSLHRARRLAAALLLAAVLPAVAVAQEAEDVTPWMEMALVGVDPGQVDEFLAAQRELASLEQKAGVAWRSVRAPEEWCMFASSK